MADENSLTCIICNFVLEAVNYKSDKIHFQGQTQMCTCRPMNTHRNCLCRHVQLLAPLPELPANYILYPAWLSGK